MAGEQDERAGGGAAGTDQGKQGGEPAKQPSPAGGAGGSGTGERAGVEGGAGKPVGLNPEILPEALRGKSEAEVKFVLNNMVSSLQKQNQRIKEMEAKQQAPQKEEKEEKPAKPYEERILEDPEGTIAEIVQKRFGGQIQQLEDGVGSSTISAVRSEVDDFNEYEDEVMSLLEEAGAPKTRQNLLGAYTMAVGHRALQERRQAQQKSVGMEKGEGGPPEDSKKVKMSELEREIAQAHGMTDEDWTKYRDSDLSDEIRVPTGKREKQSG